MDPDLVAAVVSAESDGFSDGISVVGAVGLMGVMPAGPGLEWRPETEELLEPAVNLKWGTAILAQIIRQSGGDISAALAAYNGGWRNAEFRVPRDYAREVLDDYGRAMAASSGLSPDIASEWRVIVNWRTGYLPVGGDDSALLAAGSVVTDERLIYDYVDVRGRHFYLTGYAVAVALTVPAEWSAALPSSDTVGAELMERMGVEKNKSSDSNSKVLLACLPSLTRLRGRLSTSHFAPSSCPKWHR